MSEYEEICMLCHRPESKAGKMIHMPGNLCVCEDCMNKTMETMSHMDYGSMFQDPNFVNSLNYYSQLFQNGTKPQENQEAAGEKEVVEEVETPKEDVSVLSTTQDEEEEPDKESKKPGTPDGRFGGFPGISFINLADLAGGDFGGRSRVKKKKKGEPSKPLIELKDIPAPHKLKEQLDEYVIGQEQAKKILSVAVYNHYKRVATGTMDEIEIEKSNILMLGPTGSGKTYLVKTLAKLLHVPLAIADATTLTEAGYIGDDIESVVSKLLAAADNDVEKAENGIIFIDEIDKIAKKKNTTSRDVSGESVQQGMLKLLEGAEVEVPVGANSKNAMVPLTTVNTRNILFICGGAFPDIEEIIKQRLTKKASIGYGATLKDAFDKDEHLLRKVTPQDIRKFGMIPEFIGRLPIICTLDGLDEESLVQILKEPKNAILKQYQKLLALDEVELTFNEEALHEIARRALERETGARALRAIIEEFMMDIMYEIPKDENIGRVEITKEYIEGKGAPLIEIRSVKVPKEEEE